MTGDGRVEGDRVLGFRFRNAGAPGDIEWQNKHNFVGLVNTPGLSQLFVEFDEENRRLSIHADHFLITDGSIDSQECRARIARRLTDYVLTLEENPLEGHPDRQPAVLVGDGRQPVFHDTPEGLLTLYSKESLVALETRLGCSSLDGRRFRANVVISGVEKPFEEISWAGHRICVGSSEFEVVAPVVRCLVTHANPISGQRDFDILNTLTHHFTPEAPLFGVTLKYLSGPRRIDVDDPVFLQD